MIIFIMYIQEHMIQEPKKRLLHQESEDQLNAYNRTHWIVGEHNRKEYTLNWC